MSVRLTAVNQVFRPFFLDSLPGGLHHVGRDVNGNDLTSVLARQLYGFPVLS